MCPIMLFLSEKHDGRNFDSQRPYFGGGKYCILQVKLSSIVFTTTVNFLFAGRHLVLKLDVVLLHAFFYVKNRMFEIGGRFGDDVCIGHVSRVSGV